MSKTIITSDNAGTVIAPESQGTVVAPSQQGTVVAPMSQGTVVAPVGTTVAPSGTVVAGGGTVVAGTGAPVQQEDAKPTSKKGAKMSFRMQPGAQIMLSGKVYTIVKGVSSGTEAELYVVNDGGADYAAKIYNRGFSPNAKILPDVMSIKDDDFIVHIYQSGIADIAGESLSYVLMDYCGYGATSNYSYKNNVGELLEIALQGAKALDTCHKNHILHKDIKPANILVKKRGPIEICLCDFGIADKLDKKEISTSQSRTVIYAAPEMYTTGMVIDGRTYCKLSAASDFYALGMSLLSLWVGEAKFNASEIDLAYQKKEGSLVIPRDMPATLANIVKGLTNPEPGKRWGLNEIDKELTDVLLNINQTGESQGILYDVPNNIIIKDLEDLANYLQTHADSAKRLLYRGKLSVLLKSSYPELSQDLTNIVETKYTSDQASGLAAAVFAINPNVAINLRGKKNDTGRNESKALNTIKEVSDFCCSHRELDKDSKLFLLSDTFVSWLRARDANVARAVSSLSRLSGDSDYNREFNYRLIIQTIDPFADFNLCNGINDPHYAMTGDRIAWYLNSAYNVWYSLYKQSDDLMSSKWEDNRNELREIASPVFVHLLIDSFSKNLTSHKNSYLISSLKTKGERFNDQISWINFCTDNESDSGMKYRPDIAMMKAVCGLGYTPTYTFYEKNVTISKLKEYNKQPISELKSHINSGLSGWLAVQFHENPKVSNEKEYLDLLKKYLGIIAILDESNIYVKLMKWAGGDFINEKSAIPLLKESLKKKLCQRKRIIKKYDALFLFCQSPEAYDEYIFLNQIGKSNQEALSIINSLRANDSILKSKVVRDCTNWPFVISLFLFILFFIVSIVVTIINPDYAGLFVLLPIILVFMAGSVGSTGKFNWYHPLNLITYFSYIYIIPIFIYMIGESCGWKSINSFDEEEHTLECIELLERIFS